MRNQLFGFIALITSVYFGAPLKTAYAVLTPPEVVQAYQSLPNLDDNGTGLCYLRTRVSHYFLSEILPAGALGNVFIEFGHSTVLGGSKIPAVNTSKNANWSYHVAPIYIDENKTAWVMEKSPWVQEPLELQKWLALHVTSFDEFPCKSFNPYQQPKPDANTEHPFCFISITDPLVDEIGALKSLYLESSFPVRLPFQELRFEDQKNFSDWYLKPLKQITHDSSLQRQLAGLLKSDALAAFLPQRNLIRQ